MRSKMDDETAGAILSAQIADLAELMDKSKGKVKEGGPVKDEELAVNLQLEEMIIQQMFLSDSRMATSMGNAVINDGPAMVLLAAEELRATADREVACAMAGHTSHGGPPTPDLGVEASLLSRLEALNIGMDDDTASCFNESLVSYPGTEVGERSKWATGQKYQGSSVLRECISCGDLRRTI